MKKLGVILAAGVAVVLALEVSALAEPYEGIFTQSRSLKYLNTFGLTYDDYDRIVNPRLLGGLDEDHRIISNLENVNGADALQLGYGGPAGPGRLGLLVTRKDTLLDFSHSGSFTQYLDSDGDGRDDEKVDFRVRGSGQVTPLSPPNVGPSQPAALATPDPTQTYLNAQDSTAQALYGLPIGKNGMAGLGFGYQRTVQETPFLDLAAPGNSGRSGFAGGGMLGLTNLPGSLAFTSSSLFGPALDNSDFEFTRTSLLTGNLLESGSQVVQGYQSTDLTAFAVTLGGEGKLSDDFSLGGNLLWFPTRTQRADGSGVATQVDTTPTANQMARYTQSSDSTNDLGKFGLAARAGYRLNPQNTVALVLAGEWTNGTIKAGGTTETYLKTATDNVTGNFSSTNQQFAGDLSGTSQKEQMLQIGLYDNHNFGNIVNVGFGLEFTMISVKSDTTTDGSFDNLILSGTAGQPLTFSTTNVQGTLSRTSSSNSSYSVIGLPMVAVIRPSDKVDVRFGARYLYVNNTLTSSSDLNRYQVNGTVLNGIGQTQQLPPGTFPYQAGLSFTTAHKDNVTLAQSEVDLRVGLGWEPVKNFRLDLLMAGLPMTVDAGALRPIFFSDQAINSVNKLSIPGLGTFDAGQQSELSVLSAAFISGMVKF